MRNEVKSRCRKSTEEKQIFYLNKLSKCVFVKACDLLSNHVSILLYEAVTRKKHLEGREVYQY